MIYLYIIGFIVIDQYTKHIVIENLKPITRIEVIKDLFSFVYVENYGAAFGMLEGKNILFVVLTLLIVSLMTYFLFLRKWKIDLVNVCVASIVLGAIGNLIDRLRFGYVVDFIYVHFFPAIFNVADIFITCGSIALAIFLLFGGKVEINGRNIL